MPRDMIDTSRSPAPPAVRSATTSAGRTIGALSDEKPTLLVFLRHSGCTFCREALADLARQRPTIESRGVGIVLVHMGPEDRAAADFFERYGAADLPRVSDPSRALYRAFDLKRGTLGQLFGLKCWTRGFKAGVVDGHWVGALVGDGFQMPGVFLLHKGHVVAAYRHNSAADRPEYDHLSACTVVGGGAFGDPNGP